MLCCFIIFSTLTLMNTFCGAMIEDEVKGSSCSIISMGKQNICPPGDFGFDPGEGLPVQSAAPGRVQEPGHEQPTARAERWRGGSKCWRISSDSDQRRETASVCGACWYQGQAPQIQTRTVSLKSQNLDVCRMTWTQTMNQSVVVHLILISPFIMVFHDHIFGFAHCYPSQSSRKSIYLEINYTICSHSAHSNWR